MPQCPLVRPAAGSAAPGSAGAAEAKAAPPLWPGAQGVPASSGAQATSKDFDELTRQKGIEVSEEMRVLCNDWFQGIWPTGEAESSLISEAERRVHLRAQVQEQEKQ